MGPSVAVHASSIADADGQLAQSMLPVMSTLPTPSMPSMTEGAQIALAPAKAAHAPKVILW